MFCDYLAMEIEYKRNDKWNAKEWRQNEKGKSIRQFLFCAYHWNCVQKGEGRPMPTRNGNVNLRTKFSDGCVYISGYMFSRQILCRGERMYCEPCWRSFASNSKWNEKHSQDMCYCDKTKLCKREPYTCRASGIAKQKRENIVIIIWIFVQIIHTSVQFSYRLAFAFCFRQWQAFLPNTKSIWPNEQRTTNNE